MKNKYNRSYNSSKLDNGPNKRNITSSKCPFSLSLSLSHNFLIKKVAEANSTLISPKIYKLK